MTHEKKSVKANGTCSLGKVCTCTLLMTVCSHINHKERKERVAQAVAETNSLNSDVTENPQVLCNTSKTGQERQEKQQNSALQQNFAGVNLPTWSLS